MAEPEEISVTIEDPDDSVRVSNGNIEIDQPDGGVVVQFGAAKKRAEDDGEDKFYENLAVDMDGFTLGKIADELIEAIEADNQSRQEHLAIRARGLTLLGTKLEEPRASVDESAGVTDGVSSVTNPLLLDAVLRSWANAVGELLPAQGPVKIRDDGQATSVDDMLAERFETDMNHYFTAVAKEYYPDTSHMLLWGTCFGGSGFKKAYRCPLRRRPVSESVDEEHLIVSDTNKDLASCGRITHEIAMRPSVMKRMQYLGAYREVTLTQPSPQPNVVDQKIQGIQGTQPVMRPEDQPYSLWETQCELDLPEYAPTDMKNEGIPLPYLVTIDKDSREILALRRDWREDDEHCERKRMYVRYPYVPGPGFYGTGLLNILGNASSAMTAAWREALDAGMYANFPGGVIAKIAGRQNTSNIRVAPGTFAPIETNNLPINQAIMPMPYKDVTSGLLTLMDKITSQAKGLGGAAEIPSAEGIQNVPVGTMMAQIEQATKVIAAAHKGMHTAQSEEIELIVALFRENPEDFWRNNKKCPKDFWNEQNFKQALDNCDLVPCSDPNVPSHIHRVAKALALTQLIVLPPFAPLMDPLETLKRVLAAMREDPNGLIKPPPPPSTQPSPDMVAAEAKKEANQVKLVTTQQQTQAKMQETATRAQAKDKEQESQKEIERLRLQKEMVIHGNEQHAAAQDRGIATASHGLAVSEHALDAHKAAHATDLAERQFQHDAAMDIQEAQDRVNKPTAE